MSKQQTIDGLCGCGCGEPAPIATKTDISSGRVEGQPMRFIRGHNSRVPYEWKPAIPPNPSGLCKCGCGQETPLATQTQHGNVQGHPVSYLPGHARRGPVDYLEDDRGYSSPCWIWQRGLSPDGYGRGWALLTDDLPGPYAAHRRYYERRFGPIPEGHQIDHLCRVRACVNPDHMEAVTPAVNTQRSKNTKLTEDAVREIRRLRGVETRAVLGERFGITPEYVSFVWSRRVWKNVT